MKDRMMPLAGILSQFRSRVYRLRRPLIDANIVFFHMPKCGGSSVREAIRRCYPGRQSEFLVPAVASVRAANLAGREILDLRRDLLLFALARQPRGFITGHLPFSEAAWSAFHDEWKFITLLRHPVPRWFSHYFYNRFKDGHHDPIREDLDEFVNTDRAAGMGRMFVKFLSERTDHGRSGLTMRIEAAITNLEKFDLVGVLEDVPSFEQGFRQVCGVSLAIGNLNKSPLSPPGQREMLTEDVRSRVEELCQPDLQIYEHALRMSRLHRTAPAETMG